MRLHLGGQSCIYIPLLSPPVWVGFECQSPVEVLTSPPLHIIAFHSCLRTWGHGRWLLKIGPLLFPPLSLSPQGRSWDMQPRLCVGSLSNGKGRKCPQEWNTQNMLGSHRVRGQRRPLHRNWASSRKRGLWGCSILRRLAWSSDPPAGRGHDGGRDHQEPRLLRPAITPALGGRPPSAGNLPTPTLRLHFPLVSCLDAW